MWVVTDRGFFSAVEHRDDPNLLMVRARVKADLEELRKLVTEVEEPAPIVQVRRSDYPYRVTVSRGAWNHALVQLSESIDYDNFKDSVTRRQGKRRHDVYMRVWSALHGLESLGRRRSRRSRDSFYPGDDLLFGEGTPW